MRGKRKTPTKSPLRVPEHGRGALRVGNPGNMGGTGRPASEIRARMRGSLDQRIKIAEEIADDTTASQSDRLRALDFLARYGMGTQTEQKVDATVKLAGVVVLPALVPE